MVKTSAKASANVTLPTGDKVTKAQLITLVTDKTSLTHKQVEKAVSATLECVVKALKNGQSVTLTGLGTFSIRATAARSGVRPGSNERIHIPAGKKVSYKVNQTLKGNL